MLITRVLALLLLALARADGYALSPGTAPHAQHARVVPPPGTGTGAGAPGLRMACEQSRRPALSSRREAALWISTAALLWRPHRASADDDGRAAPRAEALFAAGDPRFLQAVFGERERGRERDGETGRMEESKGGRGSEDEPLSGLCVPHVVSGRDQTG